MKVKIKKLHPDAVIPKYAKPGDAGLDLVATSKDNYSELYHKSYDFEYGTGLSVEIPEGYVGLIFPRSSISNTMMRLTNSVGVIDSSYRGEIKFRFDSLDFDNNGSYNVGDRIGQLIIIPYPHVEFEEVDELSSTERGTGGYGSTNS